MAARAVDSPQENSFTYGAGVSEATHYNYFRQYDPKTGRYTQFDPIGLAGGLNGYTYADITALIKADPNGLQATIPMPGPGGLPLPIPAPARGKGGGGGYDPRTDTWTPGKTFPIPNWWTDLFKKKDALQRCEEQCDADWDGVQKSCEAFWKVHGRNSDAYRVCMDRARSNYRQCYQDCKRDCQ